MINISTYIKDKEPKLICKDYTVSNEKYKLYYNNELDMLMTYPIPKDINKYYKSDTYISHTDNNKTITDKIYQIVRNYTLKKKLKLINSFKTTTKEVLDIGAGTGDFLKICKENNWNVYGVEPDTGAKKKAKEKGIHIGENIDSYNENKFDVITMWHVLEHVKELEDYINRLKKLLKVNGILIIAVPNYKSYDATFYKKYWAAYDVPRHIWHFSRVTINKLFDNVDMKINKIIPMKFDSYYVSLLSEKNKNNSNNFLKALYIGFKSNFKAISTKEYSSLIYIIKNK